MSSSSSPKLISYALPGFLADLYYQQILHPEDNSFNIGLAADISGDIDLRQWFETFVYLHSVTVDKFIIIEKEGIPYLEQVEQKQTFDYARVNSVLQHQYDPVYLYENLCDTFPEISENERRQKAIVLAQKAVNEPFNMNKAPYHRNHLYKYGEKRYIVLDFYHHIVFDAYSSVLAFFFVVYCYRYGRTLHYGVSSVAALASSALKTISKITPRFMNSILSRLSRSLNTLTLYDIGYFITWYNQNLTRIDGSEAYNYWYNELKGVKFRLQFQEYSSIRPEKRISRGDRYLFQLDEKSCQLLSNYLQQNASKHITLFLTLSSIFSLLLYRCTGKEDIVLSYPVNIRPKECDYGNSLVGNLVNLLAFRARFHSGITGEQLIEQLCTTRSFHRKYPFTCITNIMRDIEKASGNNSISNNLTANVGVGETTLFYEESSFEPLKLKKLFISPQNVVSDLRLLYDGVGIGEKRKSYNIEKKQFQAFNLAFEYSTDLFSRAFIERFAEMFQLLLQNVLSDLHLPVEKYNILTPVHLNLLQKFSSGKWINPANASQQKTVSNAAAVAPVDDYNMSTLLYMNLFESAVKHFPSNLAVTDKDNNNINYSQLNQRVNQLALYLTEEKKVNRQDIVCVYLETGIEWVISFLAILKCAAVYVPIDIKYPMARINFILQQTQTKFILTKNLYQNNLNTVVNNSIQSISVDTVLESAAVPPPNYLHFPCVSPNDLAYIMYTSGSTGNPKGVMIEHASLYNLIVSNAKVTPILPTDHHLQYASITFDASLNELCSALAFGACLCCVGDNSDMMGSNLERFIFNNQISIAILTPSVAATIEDFGHIHTLVIVGEKISKQLLIKLVSHNLKTLINGYGPTEVTVGATLGNATFYLQSEAEYHRNVETSNIIGTALDNLKCYVVDQSFRQQPIGIVGELCISGIGLARGYFNDPELTKSKFIANPFYEEEKDAKYYSRIYRTGDLARFLTDGSLEYVGRIDKQVKIRGVRIECGEIEKKIMEICDDRKFPFHSVIVEAIESRKGVNNSDKYLIACLQSKQETKQQEKIDDGSDCKILNLDAIIKTSIVSDLKSFLPTYMIPRHFLHFTEFPISYSGKIDTRALIQSVEKFINISISNELLPIQTDIQRLIARIWGEILEISDPLLNIGRNTNFFEIGGSSITASIVKSQINIKLGLNCELTEIFQYPVLAEIEQCILQKQMQNLNDHSSIDNKPSTSNNQIISISSSSLNPVLNLSTRGIDPPIFLIHSAPGSAILYTKFAPLCSHPVYGIQNPHFGKQTSFNDVDEASECYEEAIMRIKSGGPYIIGGASSGGNWSIRMAERLINKQQEVQYVLLFDSMLNDKLTDEQMQAVDPAMVKAFDDLERGLAAKNFGLKVDSPWVNAWMKALYDAGNITNKQPDPNYFGRVILFKCRESEPDLLAKYYDITNGWGKFIPDMEIYSIPGSHRRLFDVPDVQEVADTVNKALHDTKAWRVPTTDKTPKYYLQRAVENEDYWLVNFILSHYDFSVIMNAELRKCLLDVANLNPQYFSTSVRDKLQLYTP